MITKFETYNEGLFNSKVNDDAVKKLIKEIKSTFDYDKIELSKMVWGWAKEKKIFYDNIQVYKIKKSGDLWDYYNYKLYVNEKHIIQVSEYLVKNLFNFLENKVKSQKREEEKRYAAELNKDIKLKSLKEIERAKELNKDIKLKSTTLGISGEEITPKKETEPIKTRSPLKIGQNIKKFLD